MVPSLSGEAATIANAATKIPGREVRKSMFKLWYYNNLRLSGKWYDDLLRSLGKSPHDATLIWFQIA